MTSDGTDFFEEDEPVEDVIAAFDRGERRVTFIGQPGSGKTATASCCGERDDIPSFEEVCELPGFVGMIHGGKADLARRAKDIARGRDGTGPVE